VLLVVAALAPDGRLQKIAIGGRLVFILNDLAFVHAVPQGISETVNPGRVGKIIRGEKKAPEEEKDQDNVHGVISVMLHVSFVLLEGVGDGAMNSAVEAIVSFGRLVEFAQFGRFGAFHFSPVAEAHGAWKASRMRVPPDNVPDNVPGRCKSSARYFNTNGKSFANAAIRGMTRKRQRQPKRFCAEDDGDAQHRAGAASSAPTKNEGKSRSLTAVALRARAGFGMTDKKMKLGAGGCRGGEFGGRPSFKELLFAIDHGVDVVGSEFEAVTVSDGVGGAGFDAIAAEDAARVVDVVDLGVTVGVRNAIFGGVFGGFDVNAIGGAGGGAEEAGDAFLEAVFVALEDVNAAITRLEMHGLGGIVLGGGLFEHIDESDFEALVKNHESAAEFFDDGCHAKYFSKRQ
jgi:hypothetical protein